MEKLWSFGLTEPDYGSDASQLKTYAQTVEGGYLLNGQKTWITSGGIADYVIIWARNQEENY